MVINMGVLLLLLLLPTCLIAEKSNIYRGHKVLRVYPESTDDVNYIHHLVKRSAGQVYYWGDDDQLINEDPNGLPPHVDIAMSPSEDDSKVEEGSQQLPDYHLITDDLQQYIDDHLLQNTNANAFFEDYFQSYHPLNEISNFMDNLVSICDGLCSTFTIGTSYQGRPLKGLKISGSDANHEKPKIWIDGGTHAREWISHATAQYIMQQLVLEYDEDDLVQYMVDTFDWYILPCVNPDGYNYTWDRDRLWRKTRKPNPGTECVGTDPNRNFDYKWGVVGTSTDPCSNKYQGPEPFSEPETKALSQFILSHNTTWTMFITLHSKGQLIMVPWGYSKRLTPDYDDLAEVGHAMQDAINATHGKLYRFGSSANILYQSAGTSRDWARGVPEIKYTYTIELRDKGQYGWLLPPDLIIPTGQEIWAGLKAGMTVIMVS